MQHVFAQQDMWFQKFGFVPWKYVIPCYINFAIFEVILKKKDVQIDVSYMFVESAL